MVDNPLFSSEEAIEDLADMIRVYGPESAARLFMVLLYDNSAKLVEAFENHDGPLPKGWYPKKLRELARDIQGDEEWDIENDIRDSYLWRTED